jgi:formamidopyrimidine-DNA glycosylase
MPELPEVETIRRGLSERIVGKKIVSLAFDWAKSFQGDKAKVESYKVEYVERRAKTIQIHLSSGYNLLFHLKMTGQLIWRLETTRNKKQETNELENQNDSFAGGHPDHDWHAELPNKHTRIVFNFDDGSRLFFNDLRKFGWCKVISGPELEKIYQDKYGIEPFSAKFAKRYPNRTIKQFLLDQTIIAGIGNIYADESLFLTKISPLRKVKDIKTSEWPVIIKSIIETLNMAIKHGGTTDSDYVNADGEKGGMQDYLKVYRKTGQKCFNDCGGIIKRETVGGRGTHYCLTCQK